MKKFLLAASSLLLLGGCVSQDQADAKLAKGCEAGANALIKPATLKEIKSTNFSFEENAEGQHRRVLLNTITKDGWLETDKQYSCLFAQQWGFFKSNHAGILVQIKLPDGKIVGKEDGHILGEVDDYLKLSDTVQDAMHQE